MPIVWTKSGHYQRVDFSSEADFEASVIEVQHLLFGQVGSTSTLRRKSESKGCSRTSPMGTC